MKTQREIAELSPDDLVRFAARLYGRLQVVSHGTVAQVGTMAGGESEAIYPSGGVATKDDREADHPQKSHRHFARRLNGCRERHHLEVVAWDMQAAITAWTKTPIGPDPKPGDAMFPRFIADSALSAEKLASQFYVSKRYIFKIRENYR